MRLSHFLLIVVAGALSSACTPAETDIETLGADELVIRWGSSFGMCAGYCREELQIDGEVVRLTRRSWSATQPERVEEQPFTGDAWRALVQRVTAAQVDRLQDVYGCPDCADGGAEYVEVENGDSRKRVTFEYGSGPGQLRAVLTELRALRQRFPTR
jgi:hypothetical protein